MAKGNRIRGAGKRLLNGKFAGKRAKGRTRKVSR